jgi:phosphoserine phosphatase
MSGDARASWNDGAAKNAIVEFLTESASESSPRFIPVVDRIAAFDNDGTLWVEQPMPVQAGFIFQKLAQHVAANPSLAEQEPYKYIVNRDEAFLGRVAKQDPEAVEMFLMGVGEAWEGATHEEYEAEVKKFLASNHHERFGRPFTSLVYRPMLELIDFLKEKGWRVYVCSGGGRDFMRAISEDTWGLFKENVIGSAPEFEHRDGKFVRKSEMRGRVALGPGKLEQIFARTGRVASFAAGNGDVDIEMLDSAEFALVIVHDDDEREYASTSGAEKVLAAAKRGGWTLVSMKNDWKTVFK